MKGKWLKDLKSQSQVIISNIITSFIISGKFEAFQFLFTNFFCCDILLAAANIGGFMNLTNCLNFEKCLVKNVNTNYRRQKHLENLGIIQGTQIICLFNYKGDIIIKIKDGRLALDKDIAKMINVESLEEDRSLLISKLYSFNRLITNKVSDLKHQFSVCNKILKKSESEVSIKKNKIDKNKKKIAFCEKEIEKLKEKYYKSLDKIKLKDSKFRQNLQSKIQLLQKKNSRLTEKNKNNKNLVKYMKIQNKIEEQENLIDLYQQFEKLDLSKIELLQEKEFELC